MKLLKYLACGLIVAGSFTLASCNDDDVIEAPRLFSPVVSVSSDANVLTCKWQGIKGATSYVLTLQQETAAVDDEGNKIAKDIEVVTIPVDPEGIVAYSPYYFRDLGWDERYRVQIQAVGPDKTSNVYTTEYLSVAYPTKLKAVNNLIDNAFKLEWQEDKDTWVDFGYINLYTVEPDGTAVPVVKGTAADAEAQAAKARSLFSRAAEDEDEAEAKDEPAKTDADIVVPEANDDYYYTLTKEDIKAGNVCLYGLKAATAYRAVMYSNNGEYRGRRDFTTKEVDVYENPDLVIDLRNLDDEVADTILCTDFFNTLPDNATVLLRGGYKYVTKGSPRLKQSVTIKTGPSLEGKAIISSSGWELEGDIENVRFEDVKLTCLESDNINSNFGGRYIFNFTSTVSNLENLIFENVDIKYMRGVIRTRKAGQRYGTVSFNNCNMDSIGGYRVIQLDEVDTHVGTVNITNTTISNCDGILRSNNKDNISIDNVNVENCTFAFVSNNQPFFDFKKAGVNENLSINISNCIIAGNYVGKQGKGISVNEGVLVATNNVWVAADYAWTLNADGSIAVPFDGAETMTQGVNDIFVDPAHLDFTLKNAQLPCAAAGDPRWRVK